MKMAHLFSRQLMVMVLLSIGGTAWGDCTLDAINIAKCKSYTLEPAANYPSVDKSTDATDLTDGIFVGAMPTDAGTIGWREYPGVRITTNLNKPGCSESNNSACASISEIKLDIKDGAHSAEIWCPLKVRFEVSDDGVNYFQVATWQRNADYPNTQCGTENINNPSTDDRWISSGPLQTRGAFVRAIVHTSLSRHRYFFTDELQVLGGNHGTALTNYLTEYESFKNTLSAGLHVFAVDPYQTIHAQSVPNVSSNTIPAIVQIASRGETTAFALLLTNNSTTEKQVTINVSNLVDNEGHTISGSDIGIRNGIDVDTSYYEMRADALVALEKNVVNVPAERNNNLFFEYKVPASLTPAIYKGTITVTDAVQTIQVPVTITVEDLSFSAADDSMVWFDWSNSIPSNSSYWKATGYDSERQQIRDWADMNVHLTVNVPPPTRSDGTIDEVNFSQLSNELDRYANAKMHILNLGTNSNRFGPGLCFGTPQWDIAFNGWITSVANFMQRKGISKDRYAFYMVDEPDRGDKILLGLKSENCQTEVMAWDYFLTTSHRIHDLDPNYQIFTNALAAPNPANPNESDLNDIIDIWVPYFDHAIDSTYHTGIFNFIEQRKSDGKNTWAYTIHQFSQNSANPHSDVRAYAWKLWKEGFNGFGYWALSAPSENTDGTYTDFWNSHDGKVDSIDWGTIYLTHSANAPMGLPQGKEIIPSRRLAGLRQGVQDVRYLSKLKNLLEQYSPTVDVSAQQAVLNDSVAKVLAAPEDIATLQTARSNIISAIKSLGDKDGDKILNFMDNCPDISNADQADMDNNGIGDACQDSDKDGIIDISDAFPLNAAASIDTDGDGHPNQWNINCDVSCQSASGLSIDKFPNDAMEYDDTDNDGVGNNRDNCPLISNPKQSDFDGDKKGNVCDPETITLYSNANEDGYVTGITTGSAVSNTGKLFIGDTTVAGKGRKIILSFPLSIPVNAVIDSAVLSLVKNFNDGTPYGQPIVDATFGVFGSSSSLERSDFEASATDPACSTFTFSSPIESTSSGALTCFANKLVATRVIQLRIYFSPLTNGNATADTWKFYDGSDALRKPKLVVQFRRPD